LTYLDELQQGIDTCRYWLELPVEHNCIAAYPIGSCEACDWQGIKEILIEAYKQEKLKMCPTDQDLIKAQRELIQIMKERIELSDAVIKGLDEKADLLLKQIELLKTILKQHDLDVDN